MFFFCRFLVLHLFVLFCFASFHQIACQFVALHISIQSLSGFSLYPSNLASIASIESDNSQLSNDTKTNIIEPFNLILYAILAILSFDSFLILLRSHQICHKLYHLKATNLSFQTMQKPMILDYLIKNYIQFLATGIFYCYSSFKICD